MSLLFTEPAMPRKPSETVQLKLRFPERLRVRIEAEAEKSERSMNAEIVHRLEQSFERGDRADLVKAVASEAAEGAAYLMANFSEDPWSFPISTTYGVRKRTAKPQTRRSNAASVFQPGRKR